MSDKTLQFGVNLNNREPLIAPDYDLQALLDLSTVVEDSGFDSVWVGDSLFSKPRYEPLALLAAISQRTSRVRLGTACLVVLIPALLTFGQDSPEQEARQLAAIGPAAQLIIEHVESQAMPRPEYQKFLAPVRAAPSR